MASYMYERAFHHLDYGYGSAIGLTLFLLCVVFSTLWSRIFRKKESGEFK
jgi:ABC-type sugar transport system permease subunit